MNIVLGLVGIVLFAVCFFISSWKTLSISFMDQDQKAVLYDYWYKRQFSLPEREKLADGEYNYEGSIWYNKNNREEDLKFILSGTGKYFPVKIRFVKNKKVITGSSFIADDNEELGCHFTVTGKELPNGNIQIREKKTSKCPAHMEWMDKNYVLWRNGTALVGGWSDCTDISMPCPHAGFVWYNLSSQLSSKQLAEEEKKKLDSIVPLSRIVGKNYTGSLWAYSNFINRSGKPDLREEGRPFNISLSFPEILDSEQKKVKVVMRIYTDKFDIGVLQGTGVVTDNRLDVVETERIGGSINWILKEYSLGMPDLEKGVARGGWVESEYRGSGGSFVVRHKD